MTQAGFEPTISAGERPQTYALDHATTGTSTFPFGQVNLGSILWHLIRTSFDMQDAKLVSEQIIK